MKINTHQQIRPHLCGTPIALGPGTSRVELCLSEEMVADHTGLVHGGFVFGLADYAAMLAVNHPHVVLGAAEVKFLKPARTGETLLADARMESRQGKKQLVKVRVTRNAESILEGLFTCFCPPAHVLAPADG